MHPRLRRCPADELHDTGIQQLVLARILIDRARANKSNADLDRIRGLLDDVLEQLRTLILGLTPAVLQRLGLCAAMEWLEQPRLRWRLAYRWRVPGERRGLADALADFLFQGARELITNVARHARARTCDVAVTFGEDSVELTVIDDGIGIDPEGAAGRVAGLDGGGTLATLRLPVPQPRVGPSWATSAAGPRSERVKGDTTRPTSAEGPKVEARHR